MLSQEALLTLTFLENEFSDLGVDICDYEDLTFIKAIPKRRLFFNTIQLERGLNRNAVALTIQEGNTLSSNTTDGAEQTHSQPMRLIKSKRNYGQMREWPLVYELPSFDPFLVDKLNAGKALTHTDEIHILDTLFRQLKTYFTYGIYLVLILILCSLASMSRIILWKGPARPL